MLGATWTGDLSGLLADELFQAATQIVDLCHTREHVHELATSAARLLRGHRQGRLAELDAGNLYPRASPRRARSSCGGLMRRRGAYQ